MINMSAKLEKSKIPVFGFKKNNTNQFQSINKLVDKPKNIQNKNEIVLNDQKKIKCNEIEPENKSKLIK